MERNPTKRPPFPTELLPAPISGWVKALSVATGCDEAIYAVPALAALAASIGTTRRVVIKRTWREYPTLWTCVVAASGTRKSAGVHQALEPLRTIQHRYFEEHAAALVAIREELEQREREGKAGAANGRRTPAPSEPILKRCLVQDVTIEALAPILRDNPRGVLAARDELSGWFRSFDAYKSVRGADASQWLEFFGGRPITVDRKTGNPPTIFLPSPAVSVTGTIQPSILANVLTPEAFGSGFAARLLLAMPDAKPRVWTEDDVAPEILSAYADVIEALHGLEHATGEHGGPVDVEFDEAARAAFIEFFMGHGLEQSELTDENVSAAYSKLEAYAARLALIFHMIRVVNREPDTSPLRIDLRSMDSATSLVGWFKAETVKIYGELRLSEEERGRRAIVETIRRHGGEVTARDLQRTDQVKFATADRARTALEDLERRGYGEWRRKQGRGRPADVFRLTDTSDSDRSGNGRDGTSVTVTSVIDPSAAADATARPATDEPGAAPE